MRKVFPAVSLLRERIHYDPQTGVLTWKRRDPSSFRDGLRYTQEKLAAIFNAAHAGKPALNCPTGGGHLQGSFDGVHIKAHQAAWLIHYGEPLPPQIDHINGDGTDNRACNMRPANAAVNAQNRRRTSRNKSGVVGVYWCRRERRWIANIGGGSSTKRHFLGRFKTIDEAIAARKAAEVMLGYHENHGRK